ncbi:XRE family transcriptional regulator [Spartinivicinus ruber]|uniref:XRE family transcriptional regulator n=1 Tax=Spartinivicinus ruber TaxID=2683272 RepID=UPI0013D17A44|nr:XRE family transcriptional regulator [Spartinivicinus ruber]
MAKPLSELLKQVSPEVQAKASAKAAELLTEMTLAELRQSKDITQTELAEALSTTQPNIANVEKRSDVYLSTLRNYLHALGGELEVVARFPDGSAVAINQYDNNHTT